MSITQLLKKIIPYIQPYKKNIVFTFILTLLGSFAAQVNAFILRYTVDSISDLMVEKKALKDGFNLLLFISLILFSKEMLNALIQFGQKFYGEKLRIFISRDLSQAIIEKILTYRLAFYNSTENDSGKLQTRIDLGISSLTRLIQNFFIDLGNSDDSSNVLISFNKLSICDLKALINAKELDILMDKPPSRMVIIQAFLQ